MNRNQFLESRRSLGKTQNQMAQLLGASLKAIQSFEQGWRRIPSYIERQTFFLLACKNPERKKNKYCWLIKQCSMETRSRCPAWEFHLGHLCWFINGTICQGKAQGSWEKKMKLCKECEVFKGLIPVTCDL